jgi:hypothetical protein
MTYSVHLVIASQIRDGHGVVRTKRCTRQSGNEMR